MKRRGANLVVSLFGMILISLIGCEKDCVQGAMQQCTCASGFVSWQQCDDDNKGDWQECRCACNEGDKAKACSCPQVGHDAPMFKQECKEVSDMDGVWQWHPCSCPVVSPNNTTNTTNTNTTTTTTTDTGDDDTGSESGDDGDDDDDDDDTEQLDSGINDAGN